MECGGILLSKKGRGKEDSGRCGAGKARRNTRSVATGLPFQRGSGAVQRKCGYEMWRPNEAGRLFRHKGRQLGRVQKRMQRRREIIRTDSRKYAKLVRKCRMRKLDVWVLWQENLRKSTDFLRRIIAPVGGRGGVTLSYICPHCNSFSLEDYICWVSTGHRDSSYSKKRHRSWRCAVCGGKCEWRAPNRILVVQPGTNEEEAKVFRAHAVPQGLCENLINALMLLANRQSDGDSPTQNTVTGLREK